MDRSGRASPSNKNLRQALGRMSSTDLRQVAELAIARDAAVRQLVLQMEACGGNGVPTPQPPGSPGVPLFALVSISPSTSYAMAPMGYMDAAGGNQNLNASSRTYLAAGAPRGGLYHPTQHQPQQQVAPPPPPLPPTHRHSYGGGQHYNDNFMLFSYKVKPCTRPVCHDYHTCPYSHPSAFNKGPVQRRDPRRYRYVPVMCPYQQAGSCSMPDCPFAHNTFECCAHPLNYRTVPCRAGAACRHPFCSFIHTPSEVRQPCRKYCPNLKEFLSVETRRPAEDTEAVDAYELKDKTAKAKVLLRDGRTESRGQWERPRSHLKGGPSQPKEPSAWADLPYRKAGSPSRASSTGDQAPGTPDGEPGLCDRGGQSSSGDDSFPPSGNTSDVGTFSSESTLRNVLSQTSLAPCQEGDAPHPRQQVEQRCEVSVAARGPQGEGEEVLPPTPAPRSGVRDLRSDNSCVEELVAAAASAAGTSEASSPRDMDAGLAEQAGPSRADQEVPAVREEAATAAEAHGAEAEAGSSSGDGGGSLAVAECSGQLKFPVAVRGLDGQTFAKAARTTS